MGLAGNLSTYRAAIIAALVGLLATIVLTIWVADTERSLGRAEFERIAYAHRLALLRRAERAVEVVSALSGLFDASQAVDSEEFAAFTRPLLARHPEFRALEWAPRVSPRARAQRAREPNAPIFWQQQDNGLRAPASPDRDIFPVFYIEPRAGNEGAYGFDLASEAIRSAAIQEAIRLGLAVSTRPVPLIQDNQIGVLVFQPVYARGAPLETEAARQDAVIGVALAVIELPSLLVLVEENLRDAGVAVALYAGSDTLSPRVAVSGAWEEQDPDAVGGPWVSKLSLPGAELALEYRATVHYPALHPEMVTLGVFFSGFGLTILTVFHLARMRRAEEEVQGLNRALEGRVAARTAELARQGVALAEANSLLQESEARLRLLLEHFEGAVWTADAKLMVRTAAGARLRDLLDLGVGRQRLRDCVVNPELVAPIIQAHQRALKGEVATCEIVVKGSTFELEVRPSQGEQGGLVAVALDVSERRRLEAERLEARLQASQRLESLGILAGSIAHDFNNLLVSVLGNASLVAERLDDRPELRVFVERIELAAQRAGELTQGLLSYAGRDQLALPMSRLDLGALVRELCLLLGPPGGPVRNLDFHIPPGLPPLEGHGPQLRQVLMNLIMNASNALTSPTGTVRVELSCIDLVEPASLGGWATSLPTPGVWLQISVIDDGRGMDAETQRRIFEPFFTTRPDGHGMGLAGVLGTVRRHGGGLRVQSTPGKGTRIDLLLRPLLSAPATPTAPKAERRGSVLVVDDEEPIRDLAQTILARAGFSVVLAGDGEEALAKLQDGEPPHAVLLDMRMPGLSGLEVLARLRGRLPTLPVILSSGFTGEDLQSCATDPHLSILPKPYRARDLVAAIDAALARPA